MNQDANAPRTPGLASAAALAPMFAVLATLPLLAAACGREEPAAVELVASPQVESPPAVPGAAGSAVPSAVQDHASAQRPMGMPPGHPPAGSHAQVHGQAAEPPRAAGDVVAHGPTGVVREVLPGDGATILRIETEAGDRWAAVTGDAPAPGTRVAVVEAVRLVAHRSKALGRTFDELWLGRLANDFAAVQAPAPKDYPVAIAPELAIDAVRQDRSKLAGTTISVRGVVAKVTRRILGKDWVHLRDASTGAEGAALVLNTTAPVEPGWIVIATGTLAVDAEIGAGYRYDVLLQDAKVQRGEAPEAK